jgi:crotonobetainyl-CoA:carnitine CoA-transferase CaiB-like acyl-CoA transferase
MTAPLSAIKVIEIGTLIAAPFAARMLAEFGAEVIKIEAMGQGDPLRKWRKLHEGTSLWWYLQSRNKKSLALNLKSPEGIELVKQLATSADVLIENLRPGALAMITDVLRERSAPRRRSGGSEPARESGLTVPAQPAATNPFPGAALN